MTFVNFSLVYFHIWLMYRLFVDLFYNKYFKVFIVLFFILNLHFRYMMKHPQNRHTGIHGPRTQELDAGLWTLDSGRWTLDLHARLWTLDSGCWTLDSGRWTLDAGLWMLDSGCWTLDGRLSMLDVGRWTLDATLWTLGVGHCALSLTVLEQNQKPVSDSAGLNYWKFFGYKSLKTSWSRLFHRDYRFWCGYF